MNKLLVGVCVFALMSAVCAVDEGQCLKDGDNVVLIGDSITEMAVEQPWGLYHVLTNVAGEVVKAGGPRVNFFPLGYGGNRLCDWIAKERRSVTNDVWTWYDKPKLNVKTVLDGKVDIIVIFLGMNDILQPSMRDTDEDRAKWLADYKTFVNNLRERCHPRQFVVATITPLTADPLSPKNVVRRKLNEMLAEYAADTKDAVCCDFGGAIEGVIEMFKWHDHHVLPVPDFVHPRKYGHWKMANDLAYAAFLELTCSIPYHANCEFDFAEKKLNAWLTLPRVSRATDDEQVYGIDGIQLFRGEGENGYDNAKPPERPEVRVELPKGWTADCSAKLSDGFFDFLVRGKPDHVVNPVTVVVSFRGKELARETVNIPAPWKLSEDGGPWKFYTATDDYTGGAKPGSIDPYQCFFGWQTNTLRAARRVWSEKERDVKAVLSHQGFSETLDLTVAFDGKTVWTDKLDRNGRNHIEKTLHLKKGWNTLEITCVHHDWQRQFSFDLEPLAGDDLTNLKYDLK